jgi:hypothetical protein
MIDLDITQLERYRENRKHYIIFSIDLGKMQDFTAWTIVEVKAEVRRTSRNSRLIVPVLTVRDIVRLPLKTPYDEIQTLIHRTFWDPRLWLIHPKTGQTIPPQLVIDTGGVGDSFYDTLVANLDLHENAIGYKLVRGTSAINYQSESRFTAPRTVMFQMLDAAFANRQIIIDPRLKFADILTNELMNLKTEGNEDTGYIKVVHREGEHDDLSICMAAANLLAHLPEKRPRYKLMTTNGIEEIDPYTGVPKRRGQELRREAAEREAKREAYRQKFPDARRHPNVGGVIH